jgi:hypothetical protein
MVISPKQYLTHQWRRVLNSNYCIQRKDYEFLVSLNSSTNVQCTKPSNIYSIMDPYGASRLAPSEEQKVRKMNRGRQ